MGTLRFAHPTGLSATRSFPPVLDLFKLGIDHIVLAPAAVTAATLAAVAAVLTRARARAGLGPGWFWA